MANDIAARLQRYEAHLRVRLTESGVPPSLHDGLINYITARRPMGHFLTAIVSNDLFDACQRADTENRRFLYEITYFLYNYAPGNCWGSKERVETWLNDTEPPYQLFE